MSELKFFNLKRLCFYKETEPDSGYEIGRMIRPETIDDIEIKETSNAIPKRYNVTLRGKSITDKIFYDCILIDDKFEILNSVPIDVNPLI